MKRLAAALVTALALAGSAGADVFKVVPNTTAGPVVAPERLRPERARNGVVLAHAARGT